MKERTDASVIANGKEMAERRKQEGGKGRANNLDQKHIIAIGKEMYDGDLDKVNEVLKEKGFDKIREFPKKGDDLYLDF